MAMRNFLFLMALVLFFSSCGWIKAVYYLAPDITDHEGIFPCDTMPKNPKPNSMVRVEANEQQLPPLNLWLDAASLWEFPSQTEEELFRKTKTTSFIVLRNDSILYERYFNGYTPEKQLTVFSLTKAFVSAVTSIAVQEGYLSLDQSIADFIPEFANDGRREIKIRHLLNMTEGLNWMDYKNVYALGLLYYATNEDDFVIRNTSLRYKPGTHFAYKSITTHILGMCLEAATKRRLSDYMNEKLWQPLEMEHDGLFTMDNAKNRNNRAMGGLAVTPRALLHFGRMMLNQGMWEGKQIVSKDYVKSVQERNIHHDKWWGYSNCFWMNSYLDKNYLDMTNYHGSGFNGQYIFVSPEHNMVVIRTGFRDKMHIDWTASMGRLCAYLDGAGNDITNPEKYDFSNQFEGIYETNRSERLIVIDKGINKKKMHMYHVYKDVDRTIKNEKNMKMVKHDGRSIVIRKFARQNRLMFEEFKGDVVGVYFDDLLSIDSKYFRKTSQKLPANLQKKSVNKPHTHKIKD